MLCIPGQGTLQSWLLASYQAACTVQPGAGIACRAQQLVVRVCHPVLMGAWG